MTRWYTSFTSIGDEGISILGRAGMGSPRNVNALGRWCLLVPRDRGRTLAVAEIAVRDRTRERRWKVVAAHWSSWRGQGGAVIVGPCCARYSRRVDGRRGGCCCLLKLVTCAFDEEREELGDGSTTRGSEGARGASHAQTGDAKHLAAKDALVWTEWLGWTGGRQPNAHGEWTALSMGSVNDLNLLLFIILTAASHGVSRLPCPVASYPP